MTTASGHSRRSGAESFGFDRTTAVLAALSAAAAALVLLRGYSWGPAVSSDALHFLEVARNLLAGNGFLNFSGIPYTYQAPLYPLAIAFAGLLGADLAAAAQYINAAAFGLTVFAAGAWLRRIVEIRLLAVWAACACGLSLPLAQLSAWAMTDSLFVMFTVLSLCVLDRFVHTSGRSLLFVAASCAALAFLTRYAGTALVVCGALLLMSRAGGGGGILRRITNAAVWSCVATAPLGIWLLYNFITDPGASLASGSFWYVEVVPSRAFHTAASELARWILGEGGFELLRGFAAVVSVTVSPAAHMPVWFVMDPSVEGVLFTVTVLCVLAAGGSWTLARSEAALRRGIGARTAVPAVFIAIYALFWVFMAIVYDLAIYPRYLAPMYVPLLVVAVSIIDRVLASNRESRRARNEGGRNGYVPAICLSLWIAPQAYANYGDIQRWMETGYGEGGRFWTLSETIGYMKSSPLDGVVWSFQTRAFVTHAEADDPAIYCHLPAALPDNPDAWFAHADGDTARFVWFHDEELNSSRAAYGLEELVAALPGAEVEAKLGDSTVLKASKDAVDDASAAKPAGGRCR